MDALAPEIKDMVVKFVDNPDSKSLRLLSRACNQSSETSRLFSEVSITFDQDTHKTLEPLTASSRISPQLRRVLVTILAPSIHKSNSAFYFGEVTLISRTSHNQAYTKMEAKNATTPIQPQQPNKSLGSNTTNPNPASLHILRCQPVHYGIYPSNHSNRTSRPHISTQLFSLNLNPVAAVSNRVGVMSPHWHDSSSTSSRLKQYNTLIVSPDRIFPIQQQTLVTCHSDRFLHIQYGTSAENRNWDVVGFIGRRSAVSIKGMNSPSTAKQEIFVLPLRNHAFCSSFGKPCSACQHGFLSSTCFSEIL